MQRRDPIERYLRNMQLVRLIRGDDPRGKAAQLQMLSKLLSSKQGAAVLAANPALAARFGAGGIKMPPATEDIQDQLARARLNQLEGRGWDADLRRRLFEARIAAAGRAGRGEGAESGRKLTPMQSLELALMTGDPRSPEYRRNLVLYQALRQMGRPDPFAMAGEGESVDALIEQLGGARSPAAPSPGAGTGGPSLGAAVTPERYEELAGQVTPGDAASLQAALAAAQQLFAADPLQMRAHGNALMRRFQGGAEPSAAPAAAPAVPGAAGPAAPEPEAMAAPPEPEPFAAVPPEPAASASEALPLSRGRSAPKPSYGRALAGAALERNALLSVFTAPTPTREGSRAERSRLASRYANDYARATRVLGAMEGRPPFQPFRDPDSGRLYTRSTAEEEQRRAAEAFQAMRVLLEAD
jgi:hypothetical protein